MMTYRLKLLREHYTKLQRILTSKNGEEKACFLLCSIATNSTGKDLLAREVVPLTKNDLLVQSSYQLSVKPEVMLRIARLAEQHQLSVCFIHTHPMQDGNVNFSVADDIGNLRSFSFINRMVPNGINSALVWDKKIEVVIGRVYENASHWTEIQQVEIAGEPYALKTICTQPRQHQHVDTNQYHRHYKLIGKKGVELLSDRSFAIIGAGGIGSIANVILAHSGAGHLIPVDHDLISETNRPRIIFASPNDVREITFKVDIARNYAKRTNPNCVVHPKSTSVQDSHLLPEIVGVDALICATDDHTSRAFLNQICHQYFIPLLDLGVQFVASHKDGKIANNIGKVNLVLPGTACLLCSNHVNPERVRFEGLPDDQKRQYLKDGYIRGAQEEEPSMMMFNMEVASRGIQLLLSHMLGINSVPVDHYERFSFLGMNGARHHKEVKKKQDESCIFCGKASLCLGRGDSVPLLFQSKIGMEVEHA